MYIFPPGSTADDKKTPLTHTNSRSGSVTPVDQQQENIALLSNKTLLDDNKPRVEDTNTTDITPVEALQSKSEHV